MQISEWKNGRGHKHCLLPGTGLTLFLMGLLVVGGIVPVQADELESASPTQATVGAETETETIDRIPASLQEPLAAEQVQESLQRGAAYLLESQLESGAWGSATRTKGLNIYAPVPGSHHAFRMGTSALALAALIELEPQFPEVTPAIEKAERWIIEALPALRRADQTAMYNVWGHAYAIQALVRMHNRHAGNAERQQQIGQLITLQFEMLTRYESVDGGWGYYDFRYGTQRPSSDSISFVNATVLVAFHEAQQIGFEPPAEVVKRAIAATVRMQKRDYSYLYGEYLKYSPMHPVNRPAGSLGRSQACLVALRLWERPDITDAIMSEWLERLILRNGWLDLGRKKPIPHESWFAVAGYFYYYGHYYAALSTEQLPPEDRPRFTRPLARLMLDRQEKDGSWWDYPLYDYHQPYGTALALMTLLRCQHEPTPEVAAE